MQLETTEYLCTIQDGGKLYRPEVYGEIPSCAESAAEHLLEHVFERDTEDFRVEKIERHREKIIRASDVTDEVARAMRTMKNWTEVHEIPKTPQFAADRAELAEAVTEGKSRVSSDYILNEMGMI